MDYKFSTQVLKAQPTAIRDIWFRAMQYPDAVHLSIGNPSADTFPVAELKKYYDEAMDTNSTAILSYGNSAIAEEAVKEWLIKRGFDMEGKAIMMSNGSGGGMDLICTAFCDKGDVILAEEFTYTGILTSARMVEAEVKAVKTGLDGIDLEDLEAKAAKYNPKIFYLVPTFSNPLGVTQSLEKRKGIMEIAKKYDFMVYEDDPYARLRFKGEEVPELMKMDDDGRVVHAESFSKILSAGIRMGFVVGAAPVIEKMGLAIGNFGGVSGPTEEMVGLFLKNEDIDAQCKKAAAYYEKRLEKAMAVFEANIPEGCSYTKPEGGMFIWVEGPEAMDSMKFALELVDEAHVGVVPSVGFAAEPDVNPGHGLRCCFSVVPEEAIEPSIVAICDKLKRDFY